uniref:Uncharacterized protein n=1 Tax=Arundo donax TaxID=35708 RepID=A0A0A9ECK9_ARUDO
MGCSCDAIDVIAGNLPRWRWSRKVGASVAAAEP